MKSVILFATDKSTGEDLFIRSAIPETGNDEAEIVTLMLNSSELYEFSGWDYDYDD